MRTHLALISTIFLGGTILFAQDPQPRLVSTNPPSTASLDQQIQMLRKDIRSQRKQIIAQNMNLTDQEAEKFWPIYDQYIADLVESNNGKYQAVKDYLSVETLNDDQIDRLSKTWIGVDESVVQLRMKYFPRFRAVLPAKHAARFFQLDRRVQMMIDLQLAAAIPLVEP
jgi:hypothetical protein